MSLAEADGTLKKTDQSQFFPKDVEHGTECFKDSVCAAFKVYFQLICCAFVKYALSNGSQSKRNDVVFNFHENNSVKDVRKIGALQAN